MKLIKNAIIFLLMSHRGHYIFIQKNNLLNQQDMHPPVKVVLL